MSVFLLLDCELLGDRDTESGPHRPPHRAEPSGCVRGCVSERTRGQVSAGMRIWGVNECTTAWTWRRELGLEKGAEPGGELVCCWENGWADGQVRQWAMTGAWGSEKSHRLAAVRGVRALGVRALGRVGGEGGFAHLSRRPGSYWGRMSLYLEGQGQLVQSCPFFHSSLVLVTGVPGEAGVTPSCPEAFWYQGETWATSSSVMDTEQIKATRISPPASSH